MSYRVAILTISDKGSQGLRDDRSGPEIARLVSAAGGEVAVTAMVPDERDQIAARLVAWADGAVADVIITTGGTGLSPRDVTPEATLSVVERQVPGMAEALRAESLKKTPMAMLSRGVAGIRGQTLIVNLPGSPKAVVECLEVLLPVLPHAVETLRASVEQHPSGNAG